MADCNMGETSGTIMKVRKEQFLLPKVRPIVTNGAKWIQPNIKSNEILNPCTASSISKLGEGLPSSLLSKVKQDFVLPTGEILVTGHSGTPLIWQQQNGILRQALLNSDKDGKLEAPRVLDVEMLKSQNQGCIFSRVATNANLVAITAVNAQQFTSFSSSSQVVKMNDYQVILSSDNSPTSWQENGKSNNISLTSLPPMTKTDSSSFVINNNQMSLASFSNVNVINQNQFQTIMVDNRNPTFTAITPTVQRTPVKKIPIRPIARPRARRKQPAQMKKILLKPTSSLLSQTALNNSIQSETSKFDSVKPPTVRLESYVEPETNFTVNSSTKPLPLVNNSLEIDHNMIITVPNSASLPCEAPKDQDDGCSQVLLPVKDHEMVQEFVSPAVEQTMNNKCHPPVPNSCFHQSEILTEVGEVSVISGEVSVISGNVLIDSNTEVTCIGDHNLLHSEIVQDSCSLQNAIPPAQVLRSDVYRNNISETILPSDMEHHAEHHTQEYTDNLLSQLSNSRVLPNMSCSQVSSVLNALGSAEKTNLNDNGCTSKEPKEQLKCEPTEFVKVESSQSTIFSKTKTKQVEPKFRECELNKHVCYRCVDCMFLSQKSDVVERHWSQNHQSSRSHGSKCTITCIGCANVFHSKYSLQIHLVCDHSVNVTEVQDLINFTIAANKVPKEPRHQSAQEPETLTEDAPSYTERNTSLAVDVTLMSGCCSPKADSMIMESTPVSFLGDSDHGQGQELPKLDEEKQHSPLIPSTPSFSLFSDIDLPADKEVIVTTDYSSVDMDGNSLVNEEKSSENVQSYKNLRSKLKAEYGSDIKFNYRCMVERCGVRLSSDINLHYHLRCHKPEMDTLFCPECEVCFTNWPTLTLHLWREHKINMDLYSCIHCHYKTNSFSKLLNNHVKIHGDRKDYICTICNKGFKTGKQLRNHKVIHKVRKRYDVDGESPENESLEKCGFDYKCDICSRRFTDSRILKLHTENVHNKARPYLCTFCNHTASSKSSLRMHIRQHTGEKPFSCDECEYVTGDHNSLRRHKMRHSGKRPYQCPHCPYSCIQATTYKVHLKSKHPGLDEGLMFSCSMCPFRTVKKDNYMAHKAEHDLGGDPSQRRKKHLSGEVIQIESGEFIMPPENLSTHEGFT